MKKVLRFLKGIWILNFIRRVYNARKLYNKKFGQILNWDLVSNEDTNFTYFLTPANIQYLASTISVVTGASFAIVLKYINEAEHDIALEETISTSIKNSSFRLIL